MADGLLTQFEQGFRLSKAINQTFHEKIKTVITLQGLGKVRFTHQTNLDDMTYSRIMNNAEYRPTMRTIVAICVGLKLGIQSANDLLKSAGLSFAPTDRIHQAYVFLLENCKDMDIEQCNELLDAMGVPKARRLGSKSMQ